MDGPEDLGPDDAGGYSGLISQLRLLQARSERRAPSVKLDNCCRM